jgi:hypothetical protein
MLSYDDQIIKSHLISGGILLLNLILSKAKSWQNESTTIRQHSAAVAFFIEMG